MSERTHSAAAARAQRPASTNKLVPILAGTAFAVVAAGIGFQVFRADEAHSETSDRAGGGAGRAQVGSGAAINGTTMALVNREPITWEMVAREAIDRHGEDVLDNLINRMIIQQECERRNVRVTDAEVQQEVVRIAGKFNLAVETWYQMMNSERGMNVEQYHRDVIWPMLALKKLAGTEITVTPEELQHAFEKHYGPRVEARWIVLDGNRRHAIQVLEQVKENPADFSRLAQEHSIDPNSRALGGVIPPIRRHGGAPNIEREAFSLHEGEISPLVQIDGTNRWAIIKSEGLTKQVVTDISQVEAELTAMLIEEKTQKAVAHVFETIRSQAVIHNHLTGESSAPTQFSGGQSGIQQTAGTTVSGGLAGGTGNGGIGGGGTSNGGIGGR
jgi:foldase protein PrsA